jgi:hypothetical protein
MYGGIPPATLGIHMKLISLVKLISPLIIGLALSACATDYASQLSEPHFGARALNSRDSMDPAVMMNGLYVSRPVGTYCLAAYGCSQQPLWASGFTP